MHASSPPHIGQVAPPSSLSPVLAVVVGVVVGVSPLEPDSLAPDDPADSLASPPSTGD
jgi:hypothetical protein